jgi:sulfite reductase alpha subunit-like flavoprotein
MTTVLSRKKCPGLAVLYGSQTGCAQDVAFDVYDALVDKLNPTNVLPDIVPKVQVYAGNNFPLQKIVENNVLVFVVSTTGDGEVPDNMKTFWRFLLKKNLHKGCLSKTCFAIFGMGESE